MARIAGVNIPTNKRVTISLRYIYGIGPAKAQAICDEAYLEPKYLSGFDEVLSLEESRHTFGETQYVHGLKHNRHIVETFVRYAHKQNYIKKIPDIDSLFAKVTND